MGDGSSHDCEGGCCWTIRTGHRRWKNHPKRSLSRLHLAHVICHGLGKRDLTLDITLVIREENRIWLQSLEAALRQGLKDCLSTPLLFFHREGVLLCLAHVIAD